MIGPSKQLYYEVMLDNSRDVVLDKRKVQVVEANKRD